MGDSPKWVKSRRRRKKEKKERAKVGDNNGQATHGARKHAWRTQGARKPPGPKYNPVYIVNNKTLGGAYAQAYLAIQADLFLYIMVTK